jgi:hypothetical protein
MIARVHAIEEQNIVYLHEIIAVWAVAPWPEIERA